MGTSKKVAAVRRIRASVVPVVEATTGVAVEAQREVRLQARLADKAAVLARKEKADLQAALAGLGGLAWASEDGAVTAGIGICQDALVVRLGVEGHGAQLSDQEARAFGAWLKQMLGNAPQA